LIEQKLIEQKLIEQKLIKQKFDLNKTWFERNFISTKLYTNITW
jgi:hypothetical protein